MLGQESANPRRALNHSPPSIEGGSAPNRRASRCDSARYVQDQSDKITDLRHGDATDIPAYVVGPGGGDCTNVLALSGGPAVEAVGRVDIYHHLRREPSNSRCERHYLNDCRRGIQHALRGHHDCPTTEARLAPSRMAEVHIDHITRGQHQATSSRRPSTRRGDPCRSTPGAIPEPPEQPWRQPSLRESTPAS